MGVKGLLSIVENSPDACKEVSIEELASKHRLSFNCDPVLVVDGSNFIPWLYAFRRDSLEYIYGGQWVQFKEVLERFVFNCKSLDIKLVFMFDGTLCEEKRKAWARCRMERYEVVASIFSDISDNYQEKVIAYRQVSPAMRISAKFILKELDVDMFQTDKNVDANNYIANYANENRAVFAILSNDSEFIILDTKPMLSVSQLCLDEMKTIIYDRYSFAEHYLNLSTGQLPLFACLMGNDYILFDDLKKFHRRMVKGERPFKIAKARLLCQLIKQKMWTGDFADRRELSSISREVFGHESGLLKRGLESYVIDKEARPLKLCGSCSPSFEQVVHERHFNCSNICIYNLLCKKNYRSSEVLEDGSRLPSALVYREIRQRCYGILFNCSGDPDNQENTVIEERCWYINNQYQNDLNNPERIRPLPLRNTSEAIKIEDLWFNCAERKRFEYFWHILEIPMEFGLLLNLPEDQLGLSCILNYLIGGHASGPLLEPLDVAVFVAQAVWKPSSLTIKQLENPRVNALTVNLSTLFVNGIEPVLMALETCGFPTPYKYTMPWKFFDGKLFHFLHNEAKRDPKVQVLCNHQDEVVGRFYHLLPVVTNHTNYHPDKFDWRTILEDFNLEERLDIET